MGLRLHVKYPLLLSDFNENLIFENTEISNFMKIRPMGAELFYADGWKDRHDGPNSCFSKFCEGAQ